MNKKIIGLIVLSVIVISGYFLKDHLTLENIKSHQTMLSEHIENNLVSSMLIYFLSYILITALSIPGAAVITLLGAALFGFWQSLLLVSFASTIGATIAFLSSRYLLKDWVQTKFGDKLKVVNKGIEEEGVFYLFTLRLIPIMPFFLINILFGLTNLKVIQFYIVSQLGMLLGTAVYLNAGSQLSELESLSGIVSPSILLSFALLGLFPIIAKRTISFIKNRKSKSIVE